MCAATKQTHEFYCQCDDSSRTTERDHDHAERAERRRQVAVRTMTASQVSAALRERRLSQFELARACGLSQTAVSAMLRGYYRVKPESKALLEDAIAQLRLDEPAPPDPREPVFTIRRAEAEPVESQP
jgi:predicted XRE-type DNA-binding protein